MGKGSGTPPSRDRYNFMQRKVIVGEEARKACTSPTDFFEFMKKELEDHTSPWMRLSGTHLDAQGAEEVTDFELYVGCAEAALRESIHLSQPQQNARESAADVLNDQVGLMRWCESFLGSQQGHRQYVTLLSPFSTHCLSLHAIMQQLTNFLQCNC